MHACFWIRFIPVTDEGLFIFKEIQGCTKTIPNAIIILIGLCFKASPTLVSYEALKGSMSSISMKLQN